MLVLVGLQLYVLYEPLLHPRVADSLPRVTKQCHIICPPCPPGYTGTHPTASGGAVGQHAGSQIGETGHNKGISRSLLVRMASVYKVLHTVPHSPISSRGDPVAILQPIYLLQ